jgi:hypothetical protein
VRRARVAPADLGRTPQQRRHDALLWMAKRSAAADSDVRVPEPMLYVHASAADVTAALEVDAGLEPTKIPFEDARCELEDGTPISRRMLLRLTIQAKVRRLVFDPADIVLDAGRGARFFTPLQREVIAARDRVCWCGCGVSARLCGADHLIEWRDGGKTDVGNGRSSCGGSHRFKTNQRNRESALE